MKEEEATNIAGGFVWNQGAAFSVTIDFYKINVDDRITLFNADNNIQYFTNLVDTETTGFDILATGAFDVGSGSTIWKAMYNKSETDVKNAEVLGVEDLNTLETAPPDDKIILSANYIVSRWSFLLRGTRFGETTRIFDFGGGFHPEQTYGTVWSLDAEIAANITDEWTVAIGGSNLTDEYPDLSSDLINYFGHLPYDVLSGIGMNGRFMYIRMSYNF